MQNPNLPPGVTNYNRLPTGLVQPGTMPAFGTTDDYLRHLVQRLVTGDRLA